MKRIMALVLLVPLALSGAGCSFILVSSPEPAATPADPVDCATLPAPAALDLIAAGLAAAGTAAYLFLESSVGPEVDRQAKDEARVTAAVGFAVSGLFAASAGWGLHQGGMCREARAKPSGCDPATGRGCGLPDGPAMSWIDPLSRRSGETAGR
jgi:hypothetical protein